MIPYVVYIYSAFVWSFFTRSVTFPVFILFFFNVAYLAQLTPETATDGAAVFHVHAEHRGSGNDVDVVDKLRHQHLYYHFECVGYFLAFSLVGYLLSQTIRYPPLLDVMYVRRQPMYCAKVFAGIFVYHATCAPIIMADSLLAGSVGCLVLTVGWSVCLYYILVMEEIAWQTPRSIRAFLFYVSLFVPSTIVVHGLVERLVPDVDKRTLTAGTLALNLVCVFVLRTTIFRNRRSAARIMRNYAQEQYTMVINRRWFGFSFENDQEDAEILGLSRQGLGEPEEGRPSRVPRGHVENPRPRDSGLAGTRHRAPRDGPRSPRYPDGRNGDDPGSGRQKSRARVLERSVVRARHQDPGPGKTEGRRDPDHNPGSRRPPPTSSLAGMYAGTEGDPSGPGALGIRAAGTFQKRQFGGGGTGQILPRDTNCQSGQDSAYDGAYTAPDEEVGGSAAVMGLGPRTPEFSIRDDVGRAAGPAVVGPAAEPIAGPAVNPSRLSAATAAGNPGTPGPGLPVPIGPRHQPFRTDLGPRSGPWTGDRIRAVGGDHRGPGTLDGSEGSESTSIQFVIE